ncbi:MAG: hypothetical protein M1570_13400 [Chloroflexi bacterium]|nr:hypothetical protein [Chloroflexota bacterium]
MPFPTRAEYVVDYSYTLFRGTEKIRWYDPQPYPEDPALLLPFPTIAMSRQT